MIGHCYSHYLGQKYLYQISNDLDSKLINSNYQNLTSCLDYRPSSTTDSILAFKPPHQLNVVKTGQSNLI